VIDAHIAHLASRASATVDPTDARRRARRILGDRRFRTDPAPRPLRGPLRWLGDRLRPIGHAIARVFDAIPRSVWFAIAAAVVALAVVAIVRGVRRQRSKPVTSVPVRLTSEADDDPAALERAADDAERDGDLDRAVRLRFRAGLLRLGQRGAIRYRRSVTTGEVRRVLGSATFDELARTFERIAYGGQDAAPVDAEAARRNWPRVLDEARGQ
jgi:Domain of unknown function (DUF4129)